MSGTQLSCITLTLSRAAQATCVPAHQMLTPKAVSGRQLGSMGSELLTECVHPDNESTSSSRSHVQPLHVLHWLHRCRWHRQPGQ